MNPNPWWYDRKCKSFKEIFNAVDRDDFYEICYDGDDVAPFKYEQLYAEARGWTDANEKLVKGGERCQRMN